MRNLFMRIKFITITKKYFLKYICKACRFSKYGHK